MPNFVGTYLDVDVDNQEGQKNEKIWAWNTRIYEIIGKSNALTSGLGNQRMTSSCKFGVKIFLTV